MYPLADVLAVAKIHPFYTSNVQYPPDEDTIQAARERAALAPGEANLKAQPLLRKKDLYPTIERLTNDTSPQNTYRHNVYTSTTGGGYGSKPLFFATDALENRQQRANFGQFLRNTGLIKYGDWVVTTHCGGDLYRSLDLTLEIMENAGASILAAGNNMHPTKVIQLLCEFHANVLTGDGSQVVQVVHYISTLPTEEREKVKINKIIYTSEALTAVQKSHIRAVLGSVKIYSVLGSAEAGPYGASNPDLTPTDHLESHEDFIIDTRMTLLEILPLSFTEVPEGQTGIIAQTSLTRLRNPLVRYLTGDIGSLHPLPEQARALIAEAHSPYLRILRLQGRDRRFSFVWDGEYIEFEKLSLLMADVDLGILQWQVILDKMEPSKEASLEIRLLYSQRNANTLSEQAVVDRFRHFFNVYASNKHRFCITFVNDLTGFELSKTGRKVIKLVDRFT
ncbi:hypothetical protein B0T10DRAFT_537547 [Thelonectria olida]|uniref:AMP-dependent synthetase/ligase domain-containing protein n=1 Tax=Thelonectria olida TaxID=1576542 RepID=A0A9P8WAQ0_9HYPO|nr:hypothetical protein B0T10DRAFT_537547 [Thelonectria olida]